MWPGVATISTVVSPSVSFLPSGPTEMSRFGTPPGGGRRTLQRGVPVGRAHHHLGAVALLQLRGALVVIAVRVADDHVLDVVRIQARAWSCPSMISGSVAQAKFVSMMMIPALVWSAHEECWRVPSQ